MLDERQIFRGELRQDEKILWIGRPKQGLVVTPNDLLTICLLCIWLPFPVIIVAGFLRSPQPVLLVFMFPLVLFGKILFSRTYFFAPLVRIRTYYGVTNSRVLIRRGFFRTTIQSIELDVLPRVFLQVHGDGRGTIFFDSSPRKRPFLAKGDVPPPTFDVIENPTEVYKLIQGVRVGVSELEE